MESRQSPGREHGTARSWHPNGRSPAETPYIHGARHGTHACATYGDA